MAQQPNSKRAGGRPKKINSPAELEPKIEEYFTQCEISESAPSMMGLALHIGIDRDTLLRYSKQQEFYATIKNARDRVCRYVENALLTRQSNVTGLIFWLKNNAAWKDTQTIDLNMKPVSEMTDDELAAEIARTRA